MPSQVEPGRNGQSRAEPSHDEPRQADTSPVRAGAFWNSGVPYIFVFSLRLFRPFSKGLVTSINQIGPYIYVYVYVYIYIYIYIYIYLYIYIYIYFVFIYMGHSD